ncbi:MAG TPA: hypothetical protein VHZ95_16545, partial [Polyangiales bacterium]|nr:hypothetical protein [Polyangiales bacterium]
MIVAPAVLSPLGQVYEQTHSMLFDLSGAAPSARAMPEYRMDPVGFCEKVLGIPRYRVVWSLNPGFVDANGVFARQCPVCQGSAWDRSTDKPCGDCSGTGNTGWDGTADPLAAMLNGLAEGLDVCVEAATGTQKSYTCACALLWFLACWEGARVFTFAFVEAQLRSYMWKEVRQLWPAFQAHFPSATLLDLEIRMRGGQDNSWGAIGVSVKKRAGEEVAVAAQGMHAPHMLLIYEEMPAIDWGTVLAGENTCTAPHNLRLGVGNPDNQLDSLHLFGFDDLTGQPRSDVKCIRISALDHPNYVCDDADIVPGAASVKSIERRRTRRGNADRLFKSRVRGISPTEAADALIKLEW